MVAWGSAKCQPPSWVAHAAAIAAASGHAVVIKLPPFSKTKGCFVTPEEFDEEKLAAERAAAEQAAAQRAAAEQAAAERAAAEQAARERAAAVERVAAAERAAAWQKEFAERVAKARLLIQQADAEASRFFFRDLAKARELYQQAAELGSPKAERRLRTLRLAPDGRYLPMEIEDEKERGTHNADPGDW